MANVLGAMGTSKEWLDNLVKELDLKGRFVVFYADGKKWYSIRCWDKREDIEDTSQISN